MEGETLAIIEPIAADLDLDEVEVALLNGAVGDYAVEAGVLLLANDGYWPARLRAAGMITVEAEPVGGQLWARIEWSELDAALDDGRLPGSRDDLAVLEAAVSLADGRRPTADGRPVDLADVAVTLDRPTLGLVLAALAHAAGSHDDHAPAADGHCPDTDVRLQPLFRMAHPKLMGHALSTAAIAAPVERLRRDRLHRHRAQPAVAGAA